MSARLLDGTAIGTAIRDGGACRTCRRSPRAPAGRPGSASCSSATNPASEVYVRNKVKAGTDAGLWVDLQRLPATASLDELLALVERLNAQRPRTTASSCSRRCPTAMGKQRRAAGLRRDRSRQGRRRLPPGQRRQARAGARAPEAVHAVGRDRDARPLRHRRSPAATPSSSAAARSSASRWRCCCCSATRR